MKDNEELCLPGCNGPAREGQKGHMSHQGGSPTPEIQSCSLYFLTPHLTLWSWKQSSCSPGNVSYHLSSPVPSSLPLSSFHLSLSTGVLITPDLVLWLSNLCPVFSTSPSTPWGRAWACLANSSPVTPSTEHPCVFSYLEQNTTHCTGSRSQLLEEYQNCRAQKTVGDWATCLLTECGRN